jgi:hypothetical protein
MMSQIENRPAPSAAQQDSLIALSNRRPESGPAVSFPLTARIADNMGARLREFNRLIADRQESIAAPYTSLLARVETLDISQTDEQAIADLLRETQNAAATDARAKLDALEQRALRLPDTPDRTALLKTLSDKRADLAREFAGAMLRFTAVRHLGTNDSEKNMLRLLLEKSWCDASLISFMREKPDASAALLRDLAALPAGDRIGAEKLVDGAFLDEDALDDAALSIKLALAAPAGDAEGLSAEDVADITARHANARLGEQLFRQMQAQAGSVLEALGVKTSADLTLDKLTGLMVHLPDIDRSPFNTLLAKALWGAFLIEEKRAGAATLTFAGREKSYNISVAGFKKSISGKEQRTASFTIPARAA